MESVTDGSVEKNERSYLGVVELSVSKIEKVLSKMVDLQKSIGIAIGIGEGKDDPQETTIAKNFSNDRIHFHLSNTILSRCFHFTFVETIRSTSRSIDEQRMVL